GLQAHALPFSSIPLKFELTAAVATEVATAPDAAAVVDAWAAGRVGRTGAGTLPVRRWLGRVAGPGPLSGVRANSRRLTDRGMAVPAPPPRTVAGAASPGGADAAGPATAGAARAPPRP